MRAAVMPSLDARDMKSLAAQANKTICGARLGCSNCTDDDSCVWCESDNLCKNGTWYGPDGEIIKGCSDWRWKQCKGPPLLLLLCLSCSVTVPSWSHHAGSRSER